MRTYKSQSIRIGVRPQECLNVTFYHPFRHHNKPILGHRHTQQWQHVWVIEAPPYHNFPAEPL